MRVVQVVEFGGPSVLRVADVPDPEAGAGQVVIDVAVADVLFVDTQIRAGWGREWFPVSPPYVPGNGVAGTVASVGSDVDEEWVGRKVVARVGGYVGAIQVPTGGYAERAVADAGELVAVPGGLGLPAAITFLHDGATAADLLDHAAIAEGDRVLVNAAGGSLGSLLVPLARAAGARVVGAARGERKLALVRSWGAEAVDYGEPGWADRVREITGGVDVVFDGTGGAAGRAAFEVAVPGARFLAYGAASGGFAEVAPDDAARKGVRLIGMGDLGRDPAATRDALRRLLDDAAEGRITPVIGQTFPLEKAADAHTAIDERRTVGKTLLLVG
ncbi:MAG: zinc-binding dehydrogenase [Actinophytocola sp.]|uniref:zinc-binding dehydrogenase n=1 Tax=Actinophytocola sp. TaxID=1872138 RepID=UPI001326393C|nr:zinc-binding dehydrogenase [Actinophytocola sp.]MPZ83317.1 zinc-binding dehydrogenase [Actinophytocola sp.]